MSTKLKNAFTLAELLGVIMLLGIIAIMIATTSTRVIKNSKQSLYENQIETIEAAANKWSIANNGELPMDSASGEYQLEITRLVTDGYLDNEKIVDPRDKSTMCGYIVKNNITMNINQRTVNKNLY